MAVDFETNFSGLSVGTVEPDISYAAIINESVLRALLAAVVTPPLLARYPLQGLASDTVRIPKAPAVAASALVEGTELANTVLPSDSVTIQAAEVGVMATITDVLDLSDIPAASAARLRQLGDALAQKLDTDIAALSAGFSSFVGTSGVAMTVDEILSALFTLEAANAPKPYVGLLHPFQVSNIRTDIKDNTGTVLQSQGILAGTREIGELKNGFFANVFDIDFFSTTNVPDANASADHGGMVFSMSYALGWADKWMSRVETLRWPPIRGWVVAATSMYGVGEVEDGAGVGVITDNAV